MMAKTAETASTEAAMHPSIQVPEELRNNVFVTTLDKLYNWGRTRSVWPLAFGLACCAIEMICTAAGRYDWARFGMDITRPSPRQADLLIVSGTVTKKMVPQIVRIYNQMAQPRYVISMGACATGGGPFKEGYNVVPGIDRFIPVDVYVPGCPPTPEALLFGLLKLHEKMQRQSIRTAPWYRSRESDEIPIPVLGPDLFDPRRAKEIKQKLALQVPKEPRSAGPVPAPKPTAPPGPTKMTPEQIEARKQEALAKRAELRQAAAETVPAGVDPKEYKVEVTRYQALLRKLEQAKAGQGKASVADVEKLIAESRERLAKLTGGQLPAELEAAPAAELPAEAAPAVVEAAPTPVPAPQAAPVISLDNIPPGVDEKQYKLEVTRYQALLRKLEQAKAGQGKASVADVEKLLAEARERIAKLTGVAVPVAETAAPEVAAAAPVAAPEPAAEAAAPEPVAAAQISLDVIPDGVDEKKYKLEVARIQALQRKLEQARAGQGKASVEEVQKMIAEAYERLEKLKAGH